MKKIILFLIIVVFISGCSLTNMRELAISGGDLANPVYPTGEQLLISKANGYMICRETGLYVEYIPGKFAQCTVAGCGGDYENQRWYSIDRNSYLVFHKWISCPSTSAKDCKLTIKNFGCVGSSARQQMRISGGSWFNFNSPYETTLGAGTEKEYRVRCEYGTITQQNGYLNFPPTFSVKIPERGIYLEGSDYCDQGLLSGSLPDCNWISTSNIATWKAMQEKGNELPSDTQIGSNLKLGRTMPITCGWRVQPLYGNINPMGQYNGNDIMCVPSASGATIYSVSTVNTVGGRKYYKQGSILDSGRDFCCSRGVPCAGDSVCENYKCTLQPVECPSGTFGECGYADNNYFQYETKDGRQYVEYVCQDYDNIRCWYRYVKKDNLPCIPGECPYGKKCDENVGCVDIKVKVKCPTGQCCDEGHPDYFASKCPIPLECCYNAIGIESDPLRGICKDSCDVCEQKEICDNNADDDCDGKVDLDDPDCQICEYKEGGQVMTRTGIPQNSPECCNLREGEWIEKETKTWLGFKTEKTGKCMYPHFSWIALIIGLIGLGLTLGMIAIPPLGFAGVPMLITGVIWLILGLIGIIPF